MEDPLVEPHKCVRLVYMVRYRVRTISLGMKCQRLNFSHGGLLYARGVAQHVAWYPCAIDVKGRRHGYQPSFLGPIGRSRHILLTSYQVRVIYGKQNSLLFKVD